MKILFVFLFALFGVEAKIRILTFHCNRPDFIEIQAKLYQKFLMDDFEIIVFNDAPTEEMAKSIAATCDRLQIQCVRFEPQWHETDPLNAYLIERLAMIDQTFVMNGSVRHSHVIQYALDRYGYDHDDIVVICDGDAFPFRHLDLEFLLSDYDIIGAKRKMGGQLQEEYFWVIFIAFDPRSLPDIRNLKFHLDVIGNCCQDTGSNSYFYLEEHPEVSAGKFGVEPTTWWNRASAEKKREAGFTQHEIETLFTLESPEQYELTMDRTILHFGNIHCYCEDNQNQKIEILKKFVEIVLNEPSFAGIWGLSKGTSK